MAEVFDLAARLADLSPTVGLSSSWSPLEQGVWSIAHLAGPAEGVLLHADIWIVPETLLAQNRELSSFPFPIIDIGLHLHTAL